MEPRAALARPGRPRPAGVAVGEQTHRHRPALLLRRPRRLGLGRAPTRPLLFAGDIPRLDRPLPRALPPDADRDLMAAVGELDRPVRPHRAHHAARHRHAPR